jgi:hypothetical protein
VGPGVGLDAMEERKKPQLQFLGGGGGQNNPR